MALVDNKHLEPADFITPVIAKSVDNSAISRTVNAVDAKLSTAQLEKLNIDVGNHEAPSSVASSWLKSEGLL